MKCVRRGDVFMTGGGTGKDVLKVHVWFETHDKLYTHVEYEWSSTAVISTSDKTEATSGKHHVSVYLMAQTHIYLHQDRP